MTASPLSGASKSPMVKILPLATETLEYALPSPVVFHACFGPALGHSCSKPFSCEMASRLIPRHWGQSSAWSDDSLPVLKKRTIANRKDQKREFRHMLIS